MRFIGFVTVTLLSALAGMALAVGVRSIPDIQRYLKMRSM